MEERRSSKSHARVRFLLSLIIRKKKIFFTKTNRLPYFCSFKPRFNNVSKLDSRISKLSAIIYFLFYFLNKVTFSYNFFSNRNENKFDKLLPSRNKNFFLFYCKQTFFSWFFFSCLIINNLHKRSKFLLHKYNMLFKEIKTPIKFTEYYRNRALLQYSTNLKKNKKMRKVLTFPLLRATASKYCFISKFLFYSYSIWFKSYFSSFALKFKKWTKLSFYQGFTSTGSYTNYYSTFLKIMLSKQSLKILPKLMSYPSRRIKKNITRKNTLHPIKPQKSFFFNHFFNSLFIANFFFKPLFFKYFFFEYKKFFSTVRSPFFLSKLIKKMLPFLPANNSATNIYASDSFSFFFKKYFLFASASKKYEFKYLFQFQISVLRFMRFCSGKHVFFKIFPFLSSTLDIKESTRCSIWSQKVKYYRKVLGPKLLLNESLQILYLCLKHKDINLFSEWTTRMFYKISFWKYKTFLRYIKYVLRNFFLGIYQDLAFLGMKYQLKGKISVAGNSRTRTSYHYVGFTSHSTFNNKILYRLNLVRTFTGVLGFKIWFVF